MKVFAVPTAAAGLTAGMSVLFFIGFSRVFGDETLGRLIVVQAAAAIVLIACMPQSWAHMIGAHDQPELIARYRCALTAEMIGVLLGAAIITTALALPFTTIESWGNTLLLFYASLAIQGMGSCMGWLRANERWSLYTMWNIGPNLIRVPLIWATPWLISQGWLVDGRGDQELLVGIYFLAPDIVRLLTVAAPLAYRHYQWPGLTATKAAAKIILQNWLYDFGSAITDTADKVIVGALLGPQVLVAYFFARKLGVVVVMVTEPYYAEHYRRAVKLKDSLHRVLAQRRVYWRGLQFAIGLYLFMIVGIFAIAKLAFVSDFVPSAIRELFVIFAGVLLIDCLLAANRWSRFMTQLGGGSARLLALRVSLFAFFTGNVWLFGSLMLGYGLVFALALSWALEAAYVYRRLYGKYE